jgi:hypothetical protein
MRTIIHNHFPKIPLSGGSGHGWRDACRAADAGRNLWEVTFMRGGLGYPTIKTVKVKAFTGAEAEELAKQDLHAKDWSVLTTKNLGAADAEKAKVLPDDEKERILHRKAEALYEGSAQRRSQYPGYETRWAYAPNEVRDDFIKRAQAEGEPMEEEKK